MGAEDGKKPKPFCYQWQDAWTEDSDLGHGVRLVLYALLGYMDKPGIAWPSIPGLAAKTGYCERHVIRLLQEAEDAGWIVIERRRGPPGRGGRSNRYRAVNPKKSGDTHVTTLDDEDENIRELSGDNHELSSDTHVTEVVTPTSPEYPGNTHKGRIPIKSTSDQRFEKAPKRGSNEFLEEIMKAMEEEPEALQLEALQRVLKDVENFTANEAHWVIFHCRQIHGLETGPNDIYDLAAGVLQDLWKDNHKFSQTRFRGFLIQAAKIRDPENIHGFAETIDDVFEGYY